MSEFTVAGTSDKIWNLGEFLDFLIANQHSHIQITINPESICLKNLGVYKLLDKFSFTQVDILTRNPFEQHEIYNILCRDNNQWFKKIETIDTRLHKWNQHKIFYCLFGRPTASRVGLASYFLSKHPDITHLHFSATTEDNDLIDFELGVKISGAGFPVYKGKGARLQRALINFFLDNAREAGYLEVQPPYVVNAASGYGTGQLPDKEGQMYHCTIDDLYLIPTAEVPVTNIYRDVILNESELPIKNTAYSACFRREAGSYGKDVRGLNRLHQFDKVEIVQIQHPDKSYETLDQMVNYVQTLIEKLELPWRILRLCGGDMSFTSALTFDFEVFSAAQERWLEVSSVSNFESYQANRLKCRFKSGDKKTQLAHTLNGSALALPRIVAALLENNQTPEGIRIPDALISYTGFDMID